MTNQTLHSLQPEVLRARVKDVIENRWVRPAAVEPGYRAPEAEVDQLAHWALDAMLTRPYRVTKLPTGEEYDQLFSRVRHWVQRSRPIRITLGYGPMKNPNTTRHSRADWAEFFALCHLCTWHTKVQAVYPPGLRIKIIFDDSTISMANRHDGGQMQSYMSSIARLIKAMGFETFIVGTMRQSSFAWLFHLGFYQVARRRVRRWEQDPANRSTVEKMTEFAQRNLALPPGLSDEEQQRRWHEAAHRYRVYWEALQLSGLSRLGKNLIAMYLDGTQHHIRQAAALHLTTLGKGQVSQPWQGEGALVDNGHGKLVPIVLTAGRRDKMVCREIEGLDAIPLDGFDHIAVCWEQD